MTIRERVSGSGRDTRLSQEAGMGYGAVCETCTQPLHPEFEGSTKTMRLVIVGGINPYLVRARKEAKRHDRKFGGSHEVVIEARRLPDPDDFEDEIG